MVKQAMTVSLIYDLTVMEHCDSSLQIMLCHRRICLPWELHHEFLQTFPSWVHKHLANLASKYLFEIISIT